MLIHVKLYASLRRYRPDVALGQAFTCRVPKGTTVGQLLSDELRLPPEEVAITLVNGFQTDRLQPLSPGDKVVVFPPVAGGA